jgi:superfamily II DNA or RNA helicase
LKDFRDNKYQFLIGTDCLRAGYDLPQLRVVVQASGGTSEVEILQEAYRCARIHPGKNHAVLVDFMDSHDTVLENMSLKRREIYRKQGWNIIDVEDPKDIVWEWEDKKQKL